MDVTSVQMGSRTRDVLADYRDDQDLQNYDRAVRDLLTRAEAWPELSQDQGDLS